MSGTFKFSGERQQSIITCDRMWWRIC